MLTSMVTHPEITFELMEKAGSEIILYDPSLVHLIPDCPFPKLSMNPIQNYSSVENNVVLPKIEDLPSSSGIWFIFLTSGSTSGRPKIVPLTQNFVSIYYRAQFGIWLEEKHFDTQYVFLVRGSVCSVASMIRVYCLTRLRIDAFVSEYLGCLYTRSCVVHPSQPRFLSVVFGSSAHESKLNRS